MHILDPALEREVTRKLLHSALLDLRMLLNNLFEDLILQPSDRANLSYVFYANGLYYVRLEITTLEGANKRGSIYVPDLIAENLDAERYVNALLWKWTEHMNGIYTGKWARQWILGEK